jgi:hypothetical protein
LITSPPAEWRRSSYCDANACVEFARMGDVVALRDSKDPRGPILQFSRAAWNDFVAGVNEGDIQGE